jgi:hypothetical protein
MYLSAPLEALSMLGTFIQYALFPESLDMRIQFPKHVRNHVAPVT